ncbi:hypothetical protein [Methylomonas sp. DH-1]|uniref:hypothetical protein n=1 Tax=Methylomonas sp. (strain DH-1) TaxID=1727196 RepID=UPI000A95E092|nr:hypothetical protein [Methylomonas sp. DH-1]
MKIRKVKLSVGDVLVVADSKNKTVFRLMLKTFGPSSELEVVLDSCSSDVGYSTRSVDIQELEDLIQNSADSRCSPANAAVLETAPDTVDSNQSMGNPVESGQGSAFFSPVDFPLSLMAIWDRHIAINELRTSTRKLVFDIARIFEYPRANGFNRLTLSYDDIRRASGVGASV